MPKNATTLLSKNKVASFAAITKTEESSNSDDSDALNRFHSLMQDIWSNDAGDAFLGLVDTYMDIADEKWKIVSDVLVTLCVTSSYTVCSGYIVTS